MKSVDVVKSVSSCEKIFFFDFETRSDGLETCFEAYYCVVNVVCKLCMNEQFDSYGSDVHRCCEERIQIFSGHKCLNHFCKYMLDASGKSRSIWISHNGVCFDTIYIAVVFDQKLYCSECGYEW